MIRLADAVLHALIIMRSSMRLSLISPQPDWIMKTSSSRTDSPIVTLVSWFEYFNTTHLAKSKPKRLFKERPVLPWEIGIGWIARRRMIKVYIMDSLWDIPFGWAAELPPPPPPASSQLRCISRFDNPILKPQISRSLRHN